MLQKVEDIKQGEYVKRKPDAHKVYKRGEYDRAEGKYELQDTDDHCRYIYVKKGTMLDTGFTY
jgi:hypothetical protein